MGKVINALRNKPIRPMLMGTGERIRLILFGKEADKGLLFRLFLYVILIETAYLYLNPILYMVTTMVKGLQDLLDPSVNWIPRSLYWGHLSKAWTLLRYPVSFSVSFGLSIVASLFQLVACAMAGYAFARVAFPFKRFWFACLIFTFVIPPQVTVLPLILMYREVGWVDTYYPMIVPALFGHGLKGALYVIIYRQFFSILPKELEEAAKIDGASLYRVFFKVMLPIATPAIVVVFLFSFVWNWNDSYYPMMFLFKMQDVPLSIALTKATADLSTEEGQLFAKSLDMAKSFLAVMPPLILYLFSQRWFVEGVERTGLVE
ncbi:carbohydrate ABC transporter permease [Paenibacillus aurantius]|uniref:Carbohydrate ABC transporter permease n=1 Tax=Paenibacillus aurantius TaxID=2918900 RepID=A0AA96L9F8_9BACL|nr:carbohydrate ABC transporter permease [Paenibacillus aurantius]WNQ08944.1 carbohydrate ABC transporter permease [Paenibacillus aurantius]